MNTYEIISTIISITAVIVSLGTFFWTKNINSNLEKEKDKWEKEKESLKTATTYAQIEIMTQNRIADARSRMSLIGLEIAKTSQNNKAGLFINLLTEALEDFLNAYDEACKRYFKDKKVDKLAFESEYSFQIHELFSRQEFKEVLEKGGENEYPYIYRFNREIKQTRKS